jgi:hypothetical protein
MIELTDCVSKMLYMHHKNNQDPYCILTYLDIDETLTIDFIMNYMNNILTQNSILKHKIIEKNNLFFLDEVKSFDLKDYYTIVYTGREKFDTYIAELLNKDFETDLKWRFFWCIDKETNKTRNYLKISHIYADGYKIMDMFVNPLKDKDNKEDITKNFKRKPQKGYLNTLYHYVIGTLILFLMYIFLFFYTILHKKIDNKTDNKTDNKKIKKNTDFIICKAFPLDKIKIASKQKKITVNDFLYVLMIKTDKLYGLREKYITIGSPYYTNKTSELNNILPILTIINNSHDNSILFGKINDLFNHFKYSLFMPLLSYIKKKINTIIFYLPITYLNNYNMDYIFSAIIFPSIKEINTIKINDAHYVDNTYNSEVMYNIVSCGNNVNIICSFKEGIIEDKARFEKCIYEAYNSLINDLNPS